MATVVAKTIEGYGPYFYHVEWQDGQQQWEYLGKASETNVHDAIADEDLTPVDEADVPDEGENGGQEDTIGGDGREGVNPVEEPAERMEQMLEEREIEAQVIKREAEGFNDDEAYIIDFADDEQLKEYFDAVDAGEIVYPSQQDTLGTKWREEEDDYDTTVVMPPGALYESVLPTEEYDSDPSGGSDVVEVDGFDSYSQGQVYVNIDYDYKDALKSIDEANATWDGGQWSIDPDAIDEVEDRMADEGVDVRLSDTAKAWRDAGKD